jgi:hypothetical protein
MTEAEIEREQVAWVFGLTGGELEDKPLTFKAPDHWGESQDRTWRYHYDGLPEYASSDYPDRFDNGVYYMTLVEIGCSYGSGAPEWIDFGKERWFQVAQFANSGETECPEGPSGAAEKVGEGHTEGMERCPLCEADAGEDHGYIYVGVGCETVYKRVDFSCDACGVLKSEIDAWKSTRSDIACDCE